MKTKSLIVVIYLFASIFTSNLGLASQPLVLDKSNSSLFDSLIIGHRFYKDLATYQDLSTELADAAEEMWEEQEEERSEEKNKKG